jgi:hypothetical protein
MTLPSLHNLRVDESKIVDYLLSHSNGQGKAAFFLGLGFLPGAWAVLADALKQQARRNPVATVIDSGSPRVGGNMITEHASVVLTEDIPAAALQAGDVGVVVHIHRQGVAFEVEFMTLDGGTLSIQTLEARQVREARSLDVPHVRERIAA